MTTNIEAIGTYVGSTRQPRRITWFGRHSSVVEEGTVTPIIHAYISDSLDNDSTACNLLPNDRYGWIILQETDLPVELTIQPRGSLHAAQVEARSNSPISVGDDQVPSDWAALEVHYDPDTVKWWRFYSPWIQEAIDRGVALGRQNAVTVERVRVSRFASLEDEGYEECVLSFYSHSSRSNLLAFSPVLAEKLGEWRDNHLEFVPEEIGDLLSFEVMPMEFWRDVRS